MTEMSIKMTPVTQKRSQPPVEHTKDNVTDGKGSFIDALKEEMGGQKGQGEVKTEAPKQEKPTSEKTEQSAQTGTTTGLSTGMLDILSQLMAQMPTQETVAISQNVPNQVVTIPVDAAQVGVINTAAPVIPQSEIVAQSQVNEAGTVTIAKPINASDNQAVASSQQNAGAEQTTVLSQATASVDSKVQTEQVPANSEMMDTTTSTMTRGESRTSVPVAQAAAETAPKPVQVTTENSFKADSAGTIGQAIAPTQKTDAKASTSDTKDNEENLSNKFAPTDKLMTQKESDVSFVKISDESTKLDKTTVEQVVNNIKTNLDNEKKEFTIDLFPTNLGKISVKLISQGGAMLVELVAQNPKTQSMLLANSGEIKELVQATTGTITQVVAPNHEEAMPQNYTQQEKEQHGHSQQQQETRDEPNTTENPMDFMEVLQKLRQSKQIVTSY